MNVKINQESNVTQQQVVSFADQNQQWEYSIDNQLDDVHRTADTDDADLNNFFSRPIKIATINWPVGSTFGTTINPWSLYFENLRVINRICNFNVLRAKLCVRIMINGNGFHFGRGLASYRPLHNQDGMIGWRFGVVPADVIAASQRMHVWLDPTKSQGGTLCLPYVFYKNAMNIPEMDWREMGELDIANVTTLQHANGGTDNVTISVFAWAEDVSLSIPTIAEPGALLPQCALEEQANETDAASSGPISGPASAVARVAGSLTSVPAIGNMARATEMAAGATAGVARLFGMSRPVDSGPLQSYKPSYVGNMANTNTMDTSTKLSYDVKQELSIDPKTTGLGPADEMAISSIAARESYLTQFAWPTTAVPEDLLWNCYVSPHMHDRVTTPSPSDEYHCTPMSYVSLPFHNWRGTIKFRFQVVASAFHKGRLKVVYDPYFITGTTTEYNVQYTHVIDLANERDFTVEVQWGQEYSYLQHPSINFGVPFSTSPLSGPFHRLTNGVIGIYVVNDLTTPSATPGDVSILVSTSAGDDFEVCNPSNVTGQATFWTPQSAWEEQSSEADGDLTTAESSPVSESLHTELSPIDINTKNSAQDVYFGDPVTSIRQILKRYEHAGTITSMEASKWVYQYQPDFPTYRGYATGPNSTNGNSSLPADPTPYNYVESPLINWFTPLYLCRRGGLRHKFVKTFTSNAGQNNQLMSCSRLANAAGRTQLVTNDGTSAPTRSVGLFLNSNRATDGHAGQIATPTTRNPTLEVEFPFFTEFRFFPARAKNVAAANVDFNKFHILAYYTNGAPCDVAVMDYVAIGEDFALTFFQACPVFWVQVPPDPSTTA